MKHSTSAPVSPRRHGYLPPTRPYRGRRTASGHPAMALFRWLGVIGQWTVLFSLPVAAILLLFILA